MQRKQSRFLKHCSLSMTGGSRPTGWRRRLLPTRPFSEVALSVSGAWARTPLCCSRTTKSNKEVLQLVVGDWSLYGDAMQKQAAQAIAPAKDLWRSRLLAFLKSSPPPIFSGMRLPNRPLESGVITNIPELRSNYLHFTGAGMLVFCGVGHAILDSDIPTNGGLSDEQKQYVRNLAELDWSRGSALWANYLVAQGNIAAGKNNIVLAIANVKSALGLPVTEKEEKAMLKAKEAAEGLLSQQEPVLIQ